MARKKSKKQRVKYFFANKELHKILRLSRGEDLVVAWNYPQGKRVAYIYSDVQSRMQRAYSVSEVSKIFKRHKRSINRYLFEDSIKEIKYSIKSFIFLCPLLYNIFK